jgi:hypothetical protein
MSTETPKTDEEIQEWRTRLDELRVRGHLLRMELRDKKDDVLDDMDHAYAEAKVRFEKLKDSAETEQEGLSAGFQAAWKAFKKAYDDATEG